MSQKKIMNMLKNKSPQLWTVLGTFILLLALSIYYLVEYYDTRQLFYMIGWVIILFLMVYDVKQIAQSGVSKQGQWIHLSVWGIAAVILFSTHILYLQNAQSSDKSLEKALQKEKRRNDLLHQELNIVFKNEEDLRKLLEKTYNNRQKAFEKSSGNFGRSLKNTRKELEACLTNK